jgi:predicted HTH transcriptional regulator
MLATRSELLEKIRLGEDSFLELKEARFSGAKVSSPHRDALADGLAAFANSQGGVMILGVDDKTREVLGIPLDKLDTLVSFVRELCQDSIKPPLAPTIERLTLPDAMGVEQPVVRVEVGRSLFVHKSPGGYFHRVADHKREMQPDYLARLFQQRSQTRIIRFDEQCVPDADLDALDPALWQRFATGRTQDGREDLLQKLGMARRDADGAIRPTVAGILLAAPDPRQFLPNAFIQAVAYPGTSIAPQNAYQRDAQDIAGPLDAQIFTACDFVRKNMRVAARKSEGREDLPQYDMLAVFEALTNAVAHRDYAMYGSKIRLRLFDDRLEIYSPGAIPNSMTVESLAYRQAVRNEAVASLLARCPIRANASHLATHRTHVMDKRGEGVPLIFSLTYALSGKDPVYRLLDDAELLLLIPAANLD